VSEGSAAAGRGMSRSLQIAWTVPFLISLCRGTAAIRSLSGRQIAQTLCRAPAAASRRRVRGDELELASLSRDCQFDESLSVGSGSSGGDPKRTRAVSECVNHVLARLLAGCTLADCARTCGSGETQPSLSPHLRRRSSFSARSSHPER